VQQAAQHMAQQGCCALRGCGWSRQVLADAGAARHPPEQAHRPSVPGHDTLDAWVGCKPAGGGGRGTAQPR
jgi:hypothetical protein